MNEVVDVPSAYQKPGRPGWVRRSVARLNLAGAIGAAIVALYVLVAIFAPLLAPYGEAQIVTNVPYAPWSAEMWLGSDHLGRDNASRLIYGARNTISIALVTTIVAFFVGTTLGCSVAVLKGWPDTLLTAIVDAILSIPSLVFALILLAIFGTSLLHLILIIAILDSTRVFRLTRSLAINIAAMDYMDIARLRGERLPWILWREVLPNARVALAAEFGIRFCYVILKISALSFLGLGMQPPTADWGSMVRESATLITFGDITPLVPAAAIGLLTISINFIVDSLLTRTEGHAR